MLKVLLINSTREDIARNRDRYNKEYSSFFAVARSTAYYVSILQYISHRLVKPDFFMPSLGVKLYFALLEILLEGAIPIENVLRKLGHYAKMIGGVYIKNVPNLQKGLLWTLLTKCRPNLSQECIQVIHTLADDFTPTCLLSNGNRQEYLEIVYLTATSQTELPVQQQRALVDRLSPSGELVQVKDLNRRFY